MKAIFNYRYWVLFALASSFTYTLLAVPSDSLNFLTYTFVLLCCKTVCVITLIVLCGLYLTWKDLGKIPELTHFVDLITKEE